MQWDLGEFERAVDENSRMLAHLLGLVDRATGFAYVPDLTEFYPVFSESRQQMDADFALTVTRDARRDGWYIVGMHGVEWDARTQAWTVPRHGTVYTLDDALEALADAMRSHTGIVHDFLRESAERNTRLREQREREHASEQ